jgi:hypothetical protein
MAYTCYNWIISYEGLLIGTPFDDKMIKIPATDIIIIDTQKALASMKLLL